QALGRRRDGGRGWGRGGDRRRGENRGRQGFLGLGDDGIGHLSYLALPARRESVVNIVHTVLDVVQIIFYGLLVFSAKESQGFHLFPQSGSISRNSVGITSENQEGNHQTENCGPKLQWFHDFPPNLCLQFIT